MADLYGATITYAHINEAGQLVLLLSNDTVITAGHVVGPVGATGPQGVPGPRGAAGKDGTEIFVRSGPPDPAVGQSGDIWISSTTWQMWVKATNWGSPMDLMPGANNLDSAIRRFNGGGGGGSPRFFGMGAPSMPGGGGGGTTGAGLEQIIGYGNALPTINSPVLVAVDQEGDAMMIDLWGRSATGTDFVEVAAAKGTGTDSGHTTVFDVQMGPNPPQLSFSTAVVPGVNPGDPPQLQVYVQSNQPLLELRGRITKL